MRILDRLCMRPQMLDEVLAVDVAAARAGQAMTEEQGALGVGHSRRDRERAVQVAIFVRAGHAAAAPLLCLDHTDRSRSRARARANRS